MSLYILMDDKGGLRSSHFLIFVIVILLLGISNLGKLLVTKTVNNRDNSILVLFIAYMSIRLIPVEVDTQSYYFHIMFSEMGTNFIAGFIAFSLLESCTPAISGIKKRIRGILETKRLAITCTLIFTALMIFFLTQFLGTSLANIFQFSYLPNDYYQDFGDFITIGYCCLISIQISCFKRQFILPRSFYKIVFLVSVQALLVFICLQVVNSNKSVLVTTLVSVSTIYFFKPKNWLISRGRIKLKAFYVIPFLLISLLLLPRLLAEVDVSQLRVFDYGESSSILENTSIQARWIQIKDSGMEQFLRAPVFGDISIKDYIHSSLISVQTHLGFIGSLLLLSFFGTKLYHVYRYAGNEGLKVIAPPILFAATISSFFSWGPLWFLIGALYGNSPRSAERLFVPPVIIEIQGREVDGRFIEGADKGIR